MFGAEKSVIGSEEARQVFHWLATRFSDLTDYRFELVAAGASGDLAHTAPITLRVTHLYRREDGEWRTIHRHADAPPTGPVPSANASTEEAPGRSVDLTH